MIPVFGETNPTSIYIYQGPSCPKHRGCQSIILMFSLNKWNGHPGESISIIISLAFNHYPYLNLHIQGVPKKVQIEKNHNQK